MEEEKLVAESLKRTNEETVNEGDNKIEEKHKKLDEKTDKGTNQDNGNQGLSKTQLKKLKRKESWEKNKAVRRAKEKERLRQKRVNAKINNVDIGPSRKELKNIKMSNSKCKVNVIVDLSFDDLMDDRSIGKCNKQMLHCYSLNRRAENPMQLYFTSLSGKSLDEMIKHTGYQKWDVNISSEHFTDIFKKEDIIYLSSESNNIIEKLEDNKAYIIGGLVDHNAHKGHCFEVAKKLGIQHGQLPISEYLEMKSRKVLTIDHVFEILLHVSNGKTWKDSFLKVIPQRKGAQEKEETTNKSNDI